MCRSGTTTRQLACATILLFGWSAAARAQVLTDDQWHFGVTPYAWIVGLDGDVGVRRLQSSVSLAPWEVFKHLQFGFMANAQARKGAYGLGLDAIYAKLGDARAFAVLGDTGGLDMTLHLTTIAPSASYTIGDSAWSVDFIVGARYWNLSNNLDVTFPRLSNARSGTQQWVDATGGARVSWMPIEKLRVVALADGGGGGSRDTWQALGSLQYDAWEKWRLGAAYRVLAVNYDRNNFLFDTRLKGFRVGAPYHNW